MIGLVVVSHSHTLAGGVVELVRGIGGAEIPLRATGGLDAPGHPLGTDALAVQRAVEEVWSPDGVLVLVDLGSAVLSAGLARDLMAPDRAARVLVCDAPLVEGAVAAAVQIGLGAPLEQVAEAARSALEAKRRELGGEPIDHGQPPVPSVQGATAELLVQVKNRHGLHARPVARLVRALSAFPGAELWVEDLSSGRGPVDARGFTAVATLGVRAGHELRFAARGPEALAALDAVRALAASGFGDEDEPGVLGRSSPGGTSAEPPAARALPGGARGAGVLPSGAGQGGIPPGELRGVAASPGVALGTGRLLHQPVGPTASGPDAAPAGSEGTGEGACWDALAAARGRARTRLERERDAIEARAGPGAAALLDAQLLMLDDPALLGPARSALREGLDGAAAWRRGVAEVTAAYANLEDEYQRARAAEVSALGELVLAELGGPGGAPSPEPRHPVRDPGGSARITLARDISPAEVARLEAEGSTGLALAEGTPTAHAAILARTLGLPMVTGLGEELLALEGRPLAIDGEAGSVWLDPPPALVAVLLDRAGRERRARAEARAAAAAPAVTLDGRQMAVVANIGSPADARAAVANGAEGVGVFRTELLFLDRREAPGEEEQVALYLEAAEALGGRPLTVRTLDAGGDKPLPYLALPREGNPYLGERAIRLCLARPELFRVQLRAILRVAARHPVRVLFPMIATRSEWCAALAQLALARDELRRRGEAAGDQLPAGAMIEVPSAALRAASLAVDADFLSIGTNDLAQYTLAAERGNARVAGLADALHPAVLELLRQTVEAGHGAGKPVAVCGELAADLAALPVLLGLGVDELSMNAASIPGVKAAIRGLDARACRGLAGEALLLEDAGQVRALLSRWPARLEAALVPGLC